MDLCVDAAAAQPTGLERVPNAEVTKWGGPCNSIGLVSDGPLTVILSYLRNVDGPLFYRTCRYMHTFLTEDKRLAQCKELCVVVFCDRAQIPMEVRDCSSFSPTQYLFFDCQLFVNCATELIQERIDATLTSTIERTSQLSSITLICNSITRQPMSELKVAITRLHTYKKLLALAPPGQILASLCGDTHEIKYGTRFDGDWMMSAVYNKSPKITLTFRDLGPSRSDSKEQDTSSSLGDLQQIPDAVFVLILSYLSYTNGTALQKTCQHMNELTQTKTLLAIQKSSLRGIVDLTHIFGFLTHSDGALLKKTCMQTRIWTTQAERTFDKERLCVTVYCDTPTEDLTKKAFSKRKSDSVVPATALPLNLFDRGLIGVTTSYLYNIVFSCCADTFRRMLETTQEAKQLLLRFDRSLERTAGEAESVHIRLSAIRAMLHCCTYSRADVSLFSQGVHTKTYDASNPNWIFLASRNDECQLLLISPAVQPSERNVNPSPTSPKENQQPVAAADSVELLTRPKTLPVAAVDPIEQPTSPASRMPAFLSSMISAFRSYWESFVNWLRQFFQ